MQSYALYSGRTEGVNIKRHVSAGSGHDSTSTVQYTCSNEERAYGDRPLRLTMSSDRSEARSVQTFEFRIPFQASYITPCASDQLEPLKRPILRCVTSGSDVLERHNARAL